MGLYRLFRISYMSLLPTAYLPGGYVSIIRHFSLLYIAICTTCRKKHRERVTSEAKWLQPEATDESPPLQRLYSLKHILTQHPTSLLRRAFLVFLHCSLLRSSASIIVRIYNTKEPLREEASQGFCPLNHRKYIFFQ